MPRPLGHHPHPDDHHQPGPLTWLTSLTVHTLVTTPGLVMIGAAVLAARLDHRPAALLLALIGALVYSQQCYRTPYARCWRCHGVGYRPPRHHGGIIRALAWAAGHPATARRCRPCRGRGVRIRWGRALMNTYRRATHTPAGTPRPAPEPAPAEAAGPVDHLDALRRYHAADARTLTDPDLYAAHPGRSGQTRRARRHHRTHRSPR